MERLKEDSPFGSEFVVLLPKVKDFKTFADLVRFSGLLIILKLLWTEFTRHKESLVLLCQTRLGLFSLSLTRRSFQPMRKKNRRNRIDQEGTDQEKHGTIKSRRKHRI